MSINKIKALNFSLVFFITIIIYYYTMSPSVALWDCGEFIAASFSLGVPHPPGTPLFILIGRIFSLIPIGTIAQRITFISAFSGALASAFMYLVMLQIFGFLKKRISYIMHLSAVTGSLVASFSYSVWFSSVEAEVYALSGFVMLFMIWLTLKWAKRFKSGSHKTWRWVLLILYVGSLSIGIHLQPILIMIGIFLFALWVTKGREEYRDILLGAIFLTELLLIAYLLIKIFIETDSIGKFLPFILIIFGVLFIYLAYKWAGKYSWSRIVMISLVTLLGLSNYFYLMVRASANPVINESDPRDVKGLWDVFSRKQYGENNPLNRRIAYPEMWNNNEDLGFNSVDGLVHDVRIYFKYFTWQFTPWARENLAAGMISLWVALLYLSLGILGLVRLYYGDRKLFLLLFLTFFLFSMGLVFYLNMRFLPSDPGYLKPHEVRERDYFFASAYQWWGMFAGFGLFWLLELFSVFAGGWNKWKKTIVTVVGFVLVLIPIMGNKYSRANRRGDFMADDYGYNILISCTKPGILFTNGDNDTFPLWFQQEVIGTRKYDPEADTGIIVANFSLLNTNWYVKQIYQQGIPIYLDQAFGNWESVKIPVINTSSFYTFKNPALDPWNDYIYKTYIESNEDLRTNWNRLSDLEKMNFGIELSENTEMDFNFWLLDQLTIGRALEYIPIAFVQYQGEIHPVEILLPKDIALRGIVTGIYDIAFTPDLLLKGQQEFAEIAAPLVDTNATYAVYFSSTCSAENLSNFNEYFISEGMVYRLTSVRYIPQTPLGTLERVNFELTKSLYMSKYKFRGIFDPEILTEEGHLDISMLSSKGIDLDKNVFRGVEADRLSSNYAAGFFILGTNELKLVEEGNGDLQNALLYLKLGNLINKGNETQFTYFLAEAYKIGGFMDSSIAILDGYINKMENRADISFSPDEIDKIISGIGFFTAKKIYTYIYFNEYQRAEDLFQKSMTLLSSSNPQDMIVLNSLLSFRRGDTTNAISIMENAGFYEVDFDFIKSWINDNVLKESADTAYVNFLLKLYIDKMFPDSVDTLFNETGKIGLESEINEMIEDSTFISEDII